LPIQIGRYTSSAENDGGVNIFNSTKHSNGIEDVWENPITLIRGERPFLFSLCVICLRFQAKRRHSGGIVRHTGSGELYSERLVSQEVAEMIGQICAQDRFKFLQSPAGAQEAFILNMHGTQRRLATAYFSDDYTASVRNSTALPDDCYLYYRQSKACDMKYEKRRVETTLGFLR
jgi:hypothetical protein